MATEIQFLLYSMPEADGKVQVVIKDETIWCTQKAMAQLFGVDKSGISRHIANIYKEGELSPDTTVAKIATVVNRGIRGEIEEPVDFYNLDVIISVGYRVNSVKATRFRQWATHILNEYIRKGFVLDDKGSISAAQAKTKAESEYDTFNHTQRMDSDFDKEVRNLLNKG